MPDTLDDLARLVQGRLLGNATLRISGAATVVDARPGDITLIDQPEKANLLADTAATAAVVPVDFQPRDLPVIQVDDVHGAFARIVRHFRPPRSSCRIGISQHAIVSPSARIGADVDLYTGATIGDDVEIGTGSTIHPGVHIMAGCKIGENVTIFPNAILYEGTIVGARSIIHGCAVLGAYGFGYSFNEGRHQISAQLGYVEIGADVEIGANTTIDRGTYGPTTVGQGTKIDNLVMIAHNCRIGRHNMICSQVGIAGSTSTGDYVSMGGQAGVRDHVHIGEGSVLSAMAGIVHDVPPRSRMMGIPATPDREQRIKQAVLGKLPEMRKQLKRLEAAVRQLEGGQNDDSTQRAA